MDRSRWAKILELALPIIGGMVSQNILNLVDTWMVGLLPNPNSALAAVNLGGFANFMCGALLLGIGTGVQATAARRQGEGKIDRLAVSLNAGILLVLAVAPLFSAILYFAIPKFYPILNQDPEVIKNGVPYLQYRVLAMVFLAINFAFRGYWNAISLSRYYMGTLVLMHVSNIFMNWLFIFGNLGFPAMGATGAGLATSLSTMVATVTYFILAYRYSRENGFLRARPARADYLTLIKLSLPSGIQQLFFAAGLTALFFIIGKVGTVELAAAGVLINVLLIAILPGIGLGLSSASLVGQALGRKDVADAKRWGWDVVKIGLLALTLLGLPMWIAPHLVLSPFLRDEVALKVAYVPLQLVGVTIGIESIGLILMNALLGAGASKRVMFVSIVAQWGIFLPIAYLLGPVLGLGLLEIWAWQACYRIGLSACFAYLWHRGDWSSIKV